MNSRSKDLKVSTGIKMSTVPGTVDDLPFSLTPPPQYELTKILNSQAILKKQQELKASQKDLKNQACKYDLPKKNKVSRNTVEKREKTDLEKYYEKEKKIRKALKNANALKSDDAFILKQQHDEILELIRLVIGNQILLCQDKILGVEKHFQNCILIFISLESSIFVHSISMKLCYARSISDF